MTKEQLNQGKILELEIKNLESILYYDKIYKSRDKIFQFNYLDEVNNSRTINIHSSNNQFLINAITIRIKQLERQLQRL